MTLFTTSPCSDRQSWPRQSRHSPGPDTARGTTMTQSPQDMWSQWLLKRRFGGDPQRMQEMLDCLYPIRDKVLSHVQLNGGERLLDVGCGDGLIAFGALEKFSACRVIFSDISDDLLHHAERLTQEMNVRDRCQFVH